MSFPSSRHLVGLWSFFALACGRESEATFVEPSVPIQIYSPSTESFAVSEGLVIDLNRADAVFLLNRNAPGYDPDAILIIEPNGHQILVRHWARRELDGFGVDPTAAASGLFFVFPRDLPAEDLPPSLPDAGHEKDYPGLQCMMFDCDGFMTCSLIEDPTDRSSPQRRRGSCGRDWWLPYPTDLDGDGHTDPPPSDFDGWGESEPWPDDPGSPLDPGVGGGSGSGDGTIDPSPNSSGSSGGSGSGSSGGGGSSSSSGGSSSSSGGSSSGGVSNSPSGGYAGGF